MSKEGKNEEKGERRRRKGGDLWKILSDRRYKLSQIVTTLCIKVTLWTEKNFNHLRLNTMTSWKGSRTLMSKALQSCSTCTYFLCTVAFC